MDEAQSEFALFDRMKALDSSIGAVIAQVRSESAALHKRRDDGNKATDAELSSAKARFDKEQQQQDASLTRVQQRTAYADQIATDLIEQFRVFSGTQGLELAASDTDGHGSEELVPLEILIEGLEEQKKEAAKRRLRPKPGLFPQTDGLRWLVGIVVVVLLFSIPFVLTVALYVAGVFLAKWEWGNSTTSEFNGLVQQRARVRRNAAALTTEAQEAKTAHMAKCRAEILDPALFAARAASTASESALKASLASLGRETNDRLPPLRTATEALWRDSSFSALNWTAPEWQSWRPDASPEFAARFGVLNYDAPELGEPLPNLNLRFELPAFVPFSTGRLLQFVGSGTARQQAVEAVRAALTRTLATTPAGKARFTFIDPIGQGHNVSDFIRLGDIDKDLVSGKAWSEPRHIEDQLARLTEHTETVIQKYLRRDFASILDYNHQANEVAEPFHFVVVFDFPNNFSDVSARRLVSLARNGPRCGVFTIIVRDPAKALPHGFPISELDQESSIVSCESASAKWAEGLAGRLELDSSDSALKIIDRVVGTAGDEARGAMRVEVPFSKILASAGIGPDSFWKGSTVSELRVPIGPAGARKTQHLTLGQRLEHHGILVGRTGSGKTNLLHIIITGAALAYPPSELELYLIDLKGGVGFKPYAKHLLPHARVIAIESEREFGLSVLQGLDAQLTERFETFRRAGVDNIADFRQVRNGIAPELPRVLLIVDEFQELFSSEDAISQTCKQILERIVRQGRSFGLHVLLASQSLAGSGQLPSAVLGQMAVRIALPCNESDAKAIFAPDNNAARLLARPGEAIYNSAAGDVSGNNPFQVAHVGDSSSIDMYLDSVTKLAAAVGARKPVVFEGSEPASLLDNSSLALIAHAPRWQDVRRPKVWLGEPLSLQPPLEAAFDRRPGRHLLIVSREEAEGLGIIYSCLFALLAQHQPTSAKFYVLDLSTAESPWSGHAEIVQADFKHPIELLSRSTLKGVLDGLCADIQSRQSEPSRPADVARRYLVILGMQRARDLRPAEGFGKDADPDNVSSQFQTILRDGPEAGIHVLAWSDSVANAKRVADRRLREFGFRIGGPMSADESTVLFESAEASRPMRSNRLLFLDDEKPGVVKKFRPYGLPDIEWLKVEAKRLLSKS